MRYDEFVQRVQERGDFSSRERAVETIRIVLSTLGERLYRTTRDSLEAELPDELKAYWWERRDPEKTYLQRELFDLEEFYTRVQTRADISRDEAMRYIRVVIQVLRQAVSSGAWQDLQEAWPEEYRQLLDQEREEPIQLRIDKSGEAGLE
jgi:uncharacterized protein (DUF2267 family)